MKTVRFTKIVEELGTPEPYTLWLPPEKDRHFQSAIKAHRVMTVHQENTGHASDFGEVGFAKNVQGSYLLFPKSLKRYEGRRVVGVKYELLKQPPPMAAEEKEQPAKRKPQPQQEVESAPAPAPQATVAPPPPPPKFEPLRVFEPEPAVAKTKAVPRPKEKEADAEGRQLGALTREVRQAMKKLEQGNAVAAYRILEKALSTK